MKLPSWMKARIGRRRDDGTITVHLLVNGTRVAAFVTAREAWRR